MSCSHVGHILTAYVPGMRSFATYELAKSAWIEDPPYRAWQYQNVAGSRCHATNAPRENENARKLCLTALTFLARFTCTDGLAKSFDCGSSVERRHIMSSLHPLEAKSRDIVLGIREAIHATARQHRAALDWSPTTEVLCTRFFSPENLERFILAFWSLWYPNWPVFHKPTFSTTNKPAPLLAAMAVIGAALTSEKSDGDQAMRWADAVHSFVFSNPQLSDEPIATCDGAVHHLQLSARLDAIRAAYAMLLWMTWEGSTAQKNQARRHDFSQVVAAARSVQPYGASYDNLSAYQEAAAEDTAWRAFGFREELLRTIAYVFLLDSAFVIFYNCTPRMLVSELQINLTCPEVCFQAADVSSWSQHMATWARSTIGKFRPSFAGIMKIMMEDDLSQEQQAMTRQMSALNFFVVISALHIFIFHHRHGGTSEMQPLPIMKALSNWRYAWLSRMPVLGIYDIFTTDPQTAWRRIGFMRYVPEYWRLAAIFVFQCTEPARLLAVQKSVGREFNFRLERPRNVDETNMAKLHELIMHFKDISFGADDL
ncbi:uncharacterized protein B0I36DRAFT_425501 [Microdochium trichocladiopsis]|uniref:Xylanolytic transcriptional activator regulatory domain-containing protein n=1 Tax=Microdochium trichocladiopsis TaxID=1682393 RepID=A0A9P9BHL8_9PEZI|nr:uncharacterized protein B0I36DRAFT_425501 [Microdochium trichocladiopsis]KAH7018614.1 hypothetical protein B0I36DRAFT_425501 [Microdochium trichocladiopsis]